MYTISNKLFRHQFKMKPIQEGQLRLLGYISAYTQVWVKKIERECETSTWKMSEEMEERQSSGSWPENMEEGKHEPLILTTPNSFAVFYSSSWVVSGQVKSVCSLHKFLKIQCHEYDWKFK